MLEKYTAFIENEFQDMQILMAEKAYGEVYRRYSVVLEDLLFVTSEAEWLDFLEHNEELEERPLRLHLAAQAGICLEVGGYEGDVTDKLLNLLREDLPEKLFDRLNCPPVNVDIDELKGELEPQLKPYQDQLNPHGCHLKVFFDNTYCAGVYFIFLQTPQEW